MSEAVEQDAGSVRTVVEELGVMRRKLTITVPELVIEKVRAEKLRALRRELQVPGFRPGRAPIAILKKLFAKEIEGDVKKQVLGDAVKEALEQTDIEPMSTPEINVDEIEIPEKGDLTFVATVDKKPEIDLSRDDYVGIEVEIHRPLAKPQDIDEQMERLRQRAADYESVTDRPAQDFDILIGKIEIVVGDEVVWERDEVETTIAVLSGLPGVDAPGFRGVMSGVRVGETREVPVKLTEEFEKEEHRGAEAVLRFQVKDVKRRVIPELDDDFARRYEYESLEDLRKSVAAALERSYVARARRELQAAIRKELLDLVEIELSDELLEQETARALADYRARLIASGFSEEEADKQIEKSREELKKGVAEQVKYDLILDAIAGMEGIEPSESQIMSALEAIAQRQGVTTKQLAKRLSREGRLISFVANLRRAQTENFLYEHAKIAEITEAPDEEPELPAEGEKEEKKAPEITEGYSQMEGEFLPKEKPRIITPNENEGPSIIQTP